MRRRKRQPEFDRLEQMTLLSAVASHELLSPAQQPPSGEPLTKFVNELKKDLTKLERAGVTDVSISRADAPGSLNETQYQIDYTYEDSVVAITDVGGKPKTGGKRRKTRHDVPSAIAAGEALRIHPSGELNANAARELNTLVTDVQKAGGLKAEGYAIVSVTPILAVPGSGTEDQITYTQNGVQGTVDAWVPYRDPTGPKRPSPVDRLPMIAFLKSLVAPTPAIVAGALVTSR
jgi:hypothetical protein